MRSLISALLCLVFLHTYSQSFEGKLEYIVDTKIIGDSLINKINKLNIINKLINNGEIPNDTLTYFFSKSGDFVSISSINNKNIVDTYLGKENLIYHFVGDLSIVPAINTTIDVEEKLGTPPIINVLDSKLQIGDYLCSIVEITWKTGKYRYYYSTDILNVNPNLYKKYNYDQFYKYLMISKALPIRIEKEINNFYITTYNLYSFSMMKIDNSIFKIPHLKENKDLSRMYMNKRMFIIK